METLQEKEVRERMDEFARAARASPEADKAALALAAFDQVAAERRTSPRLRRWGYLWGFSIPPLGIVFAFIYYFSGRADGKKVGWKMMIISILGGVALWLSLIWVERQIPAPLMKAGLSAFKKGGIKGLQDISLEDIDFSNLNIPGLENLGSNPQMDSDLQDLLR